MDELYRHVSNLLEQLPEIPEDSTVSRTLVSGPHVRCVLFGFAPGQELTEHRSPMAATLHILDGDAEIGLGDATVNAGPGDLIYMAPNLPHSLRAQTRTVMLLTLVPETTP